MKRNICLVGFLLCASWGVEAGERRRSGRLEEVDRKRKRDGEEVEQALREADQEEKMRKLQASVLSTLPPLPSFPPVMSPAAAKFQSMSGGGASSASAAGAIGPPLPPPASILSAPSVPVAPTVWQCPYCSNGMPVHGPWKVLRVDHQDQRCFVKCVPKRTLQGNVLVKFCNVCKKELHPKDMRKHGLGVCTMRDVSQDQHFGVFSREIKGKKVFFCRECNYSLIGVHPDIARAHGRRNHCVSLCNGPGGRRVYQCSLCKTMGQSPEALEDCLQRRCVGALFKDLPETLLGKK